VILADAYRESEQLRGEGDAKAAEIYATAFNQNKDFFSFHRSLSAYRSAFGNSGNMMVLQPESDFFRYFKQKTTAGSEPAPVSVQTPDQMPGSASAAEPQPQVLAPDPAPSARPTPSPPVAPAQESAPPPFSP
jgi:hypothetical protein